MAEIRRHDGDDLIGIVVDAEALADDVGIGTELAAPETITEDHGVEESGNDIGLGVEVANLRLRSEESEVIRTGGESFDAFGTIAAAEVGVDGPDYRNILEDAGAILEVDEFGFGHADVGNVGAAEIVEDADELLLMGEGERAEQDGVNNAEDGDVGADAERESENRDDHEAWIFGQCAPGVANVSKEGAHLSVSRDALRARSIFDDCCRFRRMRDGLC